MRFAPLLAVAVLLALSVNGVAQQCGVATPQKFVPVGTVAGDWVVHPDVDGDWMVVGAIFGDGPVADSGAAYVYRRDSWGAWSQYATLAPASLRRGDWFGKHVAIEGDCIVVGATQEDVGPSGKAYVFRFDGSAWNEEALLLPETPPPGGRFGSGVSVSGDYIIVGDYSAFNTGRAYIYHRDQGVWVEQTELESPNPAAGSFASHSVGIWGDLAVVGSRFDPELGSNAGAVFVYRLSNGSWALEQKLLASDGGPLDTFGWWAETDGQSIVVGAPDASSFGPGAAYVFERVNGVWQETSKLVDPFPSVRGLFGYWASIRGDYAAVGALLSDAGGPDKGAAYLFRKTNGAWGLDTKVVPNLLSSGDQFGTVALDAETMVTGALGDDDAGTDAGAFYVGDLQGVSLKAAMSAFPTSGKVPLTVQFQDLSTGPVTGWTWYFGNGDSSTLQNPVVTYVQPGSYTVWLIVVGPCGQSTVVAPYLVSVLPRGPKLKKP